MIIGLTLAILIVLALFNIIIGGNFIGTTTTVMVDNSALVNGTISTFIVESQDILFQVDVSVLKTAGIALLIAVIAVAFITGIQVLGSGLNAQSAKVIIIITSYIGIWTTLSIITFDLITSIEVFGSVIYISLTLGYAIGVIQKLSGGNT